MQTKKHKATQGEMRRAQRLYARFPKEGKAAARRLADMHGTTPVEEVARADASMRRVCGRGALHHADIGVAKATPEEVRRALRREAKRRGCTVAEVRRQELAAHRRVCGRGSLYRADIMG